MPRRKNTNSDDGHSTKARKAIHQLPSSLPNGGEGHMSHAEKAKHALPSPPPDIAETIADLRYQHRRRCYAMESRKRVHLSLLALLRTALGWSKALPLAERKRIADQARALVELGEVEHVYGQEVPIGPTYGPWRDLILASLKARELFDRPEEEATKAMERLARLLPVYPWAKAVKGLGDGSLAVIIAEAGDLSNYPTHSKLWKRMGVAVMGDIRQGGLPKSAPKALWIEHGYSRTRRSRLWNVGASLIKAQVRNVKDEAGERTDESMAIGPYGERYLARKAYESARVPEMSPIHAHRRAQRYMEKRLLRDLWNAWQGNEQRAIQDMPTMAKDRLSAVHPLEREAAESLPATAMTRMPPARPNKQQTTPLLPEKASPNVSAAHGEGAANLPVPETANQFVPPLHPPGA
jgi:hypothetical protein